MYAVRQWNPAHVDTDDQPRVNYFDQEVKLSFRDVVESECASPRLDRAVALLPKGRKKPADDWKGANPRASACVSRIAAYAVDQCEIVTLHQNEVAAAANLALGAIAVGGALATTGYALTGVKHGKDEVALAASTVSANNGGRSFLPPNASTPVSAMLTAAPAYAEAVGLTDNDDFYPDVSSVDDTSASEVDTKATGLDGGEPKANSNIRPARAVTEEGLLELARVHDAVFSNCTANAYGPTHPVKPRG